MSGDGPALILTGVSGAGKTTVGRQVAERLGWRFCEADELQPPTNVARMRAGIPLTDLDRLPWLLLIRRWIESAPEPAVVACSALRRSYRERLAEANRPVLFVELAGDFELLWPRVSERAAPYMTATQLESQFAALEPLADDEPGGRIAVDTGVDEVVAQVVALVEKLVEEQTGEQEPVTADRP